MRVLTHEQMRQADRAAIAAGIPGIVLMENAAYAVLRAMESRFAPLGLHRIAIVCGKGNNGGDGLALARLIHIHHKPAHLLVLLAYPAKDLSPDASQQLAMLDALGVAYTMQWPQDIATTTLCVDALLGTGVQGEPRSPIAECIERINNLPLAKRVSIDIPSASATKADLTVTFASAKPEHALPPHCDAQGELVITPIGTPDSLLDVATLHLISPADLTSIGAPRQRDSHKGTYGHVAILGGAEGKHGALDLASEAAISAGAGWATAISPDAKFTPRLADVMRADWPKLLDDLAPYRSMAIGPGLGTSSEAGQFTRELYRNHPGTLILDADALNLLSPLEEASSSSGLRVLTPHPGEMRRLLGREIQDRVEDARALAAKVNATIILKGHRSIIAFADGHVWINPTGSPSLAKAGSGDVLTGMLTALHSQYPQQPRQATLAAVYLHGRCGELAASHGHEMTSLASKLCDYLPEALRELA